MANQNSVPSLGRVSQQIASIYENLYSLYGTRNDLDDLGRLDEVARISVDIEKWERRVEQLRAARTAMRDAAERAAAQAWAEAQVAWQHGASVGVSA